MSWFLHTGVWLLAILAIATVIVYEGEAGTLASTVAAQQDTIQEQKQLISKLNDAVAREIPDILYLPRFCPVENGLLDVE